MGFTNKNERIDSSTSSILRVVLPLVLSAFSENLMFLIDRLFLAYYSVDSMNAAMLGGHLAGLYTFALMSIAGMTEVFVGQYNGENKFDKIASPVWQMIYFVLFSLILVIPLGYFTEYLHLIPEYYAREGIPYQRILTYFCWVPALTAAFTGFFVGRGETKIITITVIVGTVVNVVMDRLFVFGYRDIIPAMGCNGAAIGTVISEIVQIIILAIRFFWKKNRMAYNTVKNCKFDKDLFLKCLRVGGPMSFGRCLEMLAWYLVNVVMSKVSSNLATMQAIAGTVYVMFTFVCDGLTKGSAALSSNFIGQRNIAAVRQTFRKLTIMTLVLCFVVIFPLLMFPNPIFRLMDTLHEDISNLYGPMSMVFKVMFVGIVADTLGAISCGILMSGGDTKFPIIASSSSIWLVLVAPVLILFYIGKLQSAVVVELFATIGLILYAILVYLRYRKLGWLKSLTS
ncbi:MAG: polysaccharide biosynthesis C-terminal domain-containing protein [Puniceicoccales bacterium]|jgi:MATE family multidrug resistance protein|nr:polysaccharide biosynthesis C-terminal domain-containing protein [Puniceicoccales bacterium]